MRTGRVQIWRLHCLTVRANMNSRARSNKIQAKGAGLIDVAVQRQQQVSEEREDGRKTTIDIYRHYIRRRRLAPT